MKQGWEIKKLGEVCEIQGGSTPKRTESSFWENGTYPWFTIEDIREQGHIISDTKQKITKIAWDKMRIFPKDTILLCCTASLGEYAITQIPLSSNQQFNGLTIKDKNYLSPMYLMHYCSTLKNTLLSLSGKATIDFVSAEKVRQISIPVPPREEQERIVAELDCLSGIIERKREQLKQLDALAQSIFYQMFGDPITNEKGWEVKKLGEVCDIYRGGSPRPIEQYLGGNIPWIKIGDAVFGTDIYLTKTKEHIIEEGLKKTRFIHSGSLIFANCGVSLGFARIITFDGCIHDGWLAFDNISNDINKIFLLKSLNFCTQYFRETAPDGTQPNLNTGIMKAFAQIIPPLALQQEFAEKIEAIEKQKRVD